MSETKQQPIELLDLQAVADRYSVTIRSVQNWMKINPEFPAPLRFSRRIVRWRLADLERFEAGGK
jgi:predicted DNA-binding transcriptional regulator AlpA